MNVRVRHKQRAVKKPANLSINANLLSEARRLKINLSQTLESCLAEIVHESRSRKWLKDNSAALEGYNDHIERHGAFSDRLRRF